MPLKTSLVHQPVQPPNNWYFDFVVSERPPYIPGSGPALAPITPMPSHDKNGHILELVCIHDQHKYIVGFDDHPSLRVGVNLKNIRDWVSAHTFEQWEFTQQILREKEQAAMYKPKMKAKTAKSRGGRSGRKRKHTEFTDSLTQETQILPGMGTVPHSQPSLSTPSGMKTGLAYPANLESEEDDDDEDEEGEGEDNTQLALENQLAAGLVHYGDDDQDTSRSVSVESSGHLRGDCVSISKPNSRLRQSSRPASLSSSSSSTSNRAQSQAPTPIGGRDAVAHISSIEARKKLEGLEQSIGSPLEKKTIAQKYSRLASEPLATRSQIPKSTNTSSATKDSVSSRARPKYLEIPPGYDEQDESDGPTDDAIIPVSKDQAIADEEPKEEEYELQEIVSHEMRQLKNGTNQLYYLIQWVGDWEDTWEPAYQVGTMAIDGYDEKRREAKMKKRDAKDKSSKADSAVDVDEREKKREVKRNTKDKLSKADSPTSDEQGEHEKKVKAKEKVFKPVVRQSAYFDEFDDELGGDGNELPEEEY